MNQRNKNKGITLIALVITIIILLILAGITIGQLTENGLFEKVQLAKEKSNKSQIDENEILNDYENKINQYIDGTRNENKNEKEYSTEEQVVGTWIDGKNIYRKVISFSESVTAYSNVRYISIKVLDNIDNIIDSGGYFLLKDRKIKFGSSEGNWENVPSFHSYADVSTNALYIHILYNYKNYQNNPITGTIWAEYTKVN